MKLMFSGSIQMVCLYKEKTLCQENLSVFLKLLKQFYTFL